MSRTARLFPLLAVVGLIAGCGGSSSDAPTTTDQAAPAPGSGTLRVGTTDAGIGEAIVGGPGGIKALPKTEVPGTPNTKQGVGAGSSCADKELVPTPDNLPAVSTATLCLLNGERADAGLGALDQNPQLAEAAIGHSREMVAKQFFDHTGMDGSDPVDRIRATGYIPNQGSWTVGENLAWGTGSLATPKEIVAAWMKSQGHRDNILRASYKEIGFGVVAGNPRSDSGNGATFTTAFGAKEGATNAAAAVPAATKARKKKRKARRARRARAAKARAAKASAKAKPKSTKPSGSRNRTRPSGSR